MMSSKKTAAFVGLSLAGLVLLAFSFVKNLIVRFSSIKVSGTFFEPEFLLTITITNPRRGALKVDGVIGKILYEQKYIADIVVSDSFQIPSLDFVSINVRVVPIFDEVVDVLKVVLQSKVSNDFYFDGKIVVAGVPISLKQKLGS